MPFYFLVVNNDADIGDKLKVLFLENYRVSMAEKSILSSKIALILFVCYTADVQQNYLSSCRACHRNLLTPGFFCVYITKILVCRLL